MSAPLISDAARAEWEAHCIRWRGRVLTGRYAHSCIDWDDLPIDETCENEWPCPCKPYLDENLAALELDPK